MTGRLWKEAENVSRRDAGNLLIGQKMFKWEAGKVWWMRSII
jgi:hypothetical protein